LFLLQVEKIEEGGLDDFREVGHSAQLGEVRGEEFAGVLEATAEVASWSGVGTGGRGKVGGESVEKEW